MWYICSDIHIGRGGSRQDYLYSTLIPQIKKGDTLVLLGDIFDYWISSNIHGLEQLNAGWLKLIEKLKQLRNNGIEVIFVPGNHDSFIFYNEWNLAGSSPRWLNRLYEQKTQFAKICDGTTISSPLSDVATIHYPAFIKTFGRTNILFTHGHWTEQVWSFITNDPTDPFIEDTRNTFLKTWASVKAHTIAFSYNHPDLMRQLFLGVGKLAEIIPYFLPEIMDERGGGFGGTIAPRELDPFVDIRRTEDILFTVASDVYQDTDISFAMKDPTIENPESQTHFSQKLKDQIHSQVASAEIDPIELLGQRRGRKLIPKWTRENNPDREWVYALQRMVNILTGEIKVFTIENRDNKESRLAFPPRATESDLPQAQKGNNSLILIHGHYHLPRRGSLVIDEGCMLEFRPSFKITTYLKIDAAGRIFGP